MSVFDIARNDIASCEEHYRARNGDVAENELEVMLMLQDDPGDLIEALARIDQELKAESEEASSD